ncbi:unnamed protein product [Durusdinium trenchii]|uniref:Uncharacterized protein n=2 Tax=Durusdinium trenchii TaxID=1381693 RepID=A0ABP0MRF4_9DINO
MESPQSGLVAGDPSKQWEWHEAYRDLFKNMYRTTYSDMSHGRETYVRSDLPAGYGGHIPSIRFDVLHRNTAFDRKMALLRTDPSRDAMPSFKSNLDGVPWYTKHPCGARKNPTKGVVPHNGTTTMLKPPWGILTGKRDPLNYRAVPATMKRALSSPAVGERSNVAARNAGSLMTESSSAAQLEMPKAADSPKPNMRWADESQDEMGQSQMLEQSTDI